MSALVTLASLVTSTAQNQHDDNNDQNGKGSNKTVLGNSVEEEGTTVSVIGFGTARTSHSGRNAVVTTAVKFLLDSDPFFRTFLNDLHGSIIDKFNNSVLGVFRAESEVDGNQDNINDNNGDGKKGDEDNIEIENAATKSSTNTDNGENDQNNTSGNEEGAEGLQNHQNRRNFLTGGKIETSSNEKSTDKEQDNIHGDQATLSFSFTLRHL